jgi:hypothetical protein
MLKTNAKQSLIVIAVSLIISMTTVYAADSSRTNSSSLPKVNIDLGGMGIITSETPDYYPATFQRTGKIYTLGTSNITITGSSTGFSLSPNILVHSMSSEFLSKRDLKQGLEVGFSFVKGMDGKSTVTEIWILPRGTLLRG